ncbi:MAG: hypothetical protein IKQ07_04630 [Bacteroidaceae bacterium]|nr:hypothetical protein [Bacteroidaceae bacterium]
MKSDYIYFDTVGLTSTSANHVANMAKESVRNTSNGLSAISFFNTTVSLLSGGTPQTSKLGSKREELDDILKSLEAIGEANALCAWLREAIKARERLLSEVKCMTLENYCKDILGGVEVPKQDTNIDDWMKKNGYTKPDINGEFPGVLRSPSYGMVESRLSLFCRKFGVEMPQSPVQEPAMTEDEYMSKLSVKDRNHFLMLEAKAATIGRFIHEDGALYNERERLRAIIAKPIATQGEGSNTLIYHFEPSVSIDEVEALFFRLSAEHRALQAELNGLLAERARTIEADKQEKAAAYQKASEEFARETSKLQDQLGSYMLDERKKMSQYQAEYDAWSTEQKNRHKQLCDDLMVWKLKEAERIASLGIVIPNELRDIYERVNGLGK